MEKKSEKLRVFYICLFLAVVVLALYWPVHKYDFVRYDDDKYVTQNRNVQLGINLETIRWAFTKYHASNWHPVTWISHMLDCQLFGLNAGPHHLVNVFFHIINTLLLFLVFNRMTRAIWLSAFIAAVFGLHPLHVESVAWISERKDVLSTFFWMLTMLAYVSYTEKPKFTRYIVTLILFVIGLMAKPMLVTLPFVLLLLDYWPLERTCFSLPCKDVTSESNDENNDISTKSIKYLILEKVPFFACALGSSIVTFIVQRQSGAVQSIGSIGLKSRIGNTFISYISYIYKMFWPSKLAILYPYPDKISLLKVIICVILLVGITIAVIVLSRRHKYMVTGWLWYVGTLIPVIGLVQVGVQELADRYTYIPMTGLLIMIAWGMNDIIKTGKNRKAVFIALSVLLIPAMFIKTSIQLKYWENSMTLFKHALDVTKNNYIICNNYGNFLYRNGQVDQAIEYIKKSISINPNSAESHNNLANILNAQGDIDEAIAQYRIALKINPNSAEPHHNIAVALLKKNMVDEAIAEYREAIRLNPYSVDSISNLGFELEQKGNLDEAIQLYRRALSINSADVITHGRLGLALAAQGNLDEAIKELSIVLEARPKDVEMWCNLGILLERQNKIPEAIEKYRTALQFNPDYEKAKSLLQAALKKLQAQP